MSWEQAGKQAQFEQNMHDRTPEDLEASRQNQRDAVIENYRQTLEKLEEQILRAQKQLDAIKQDIDGSHEQRILEYKDREDKIAIAQDSVRQFSIKVNADQVEVLAKQKSLNELIESEKNRMTNIQTALTAQFDQLEAQKIALLAQEKALNERAMAHVEIHTGLSQRAQELNEQEMNINQTIAEYVQKSSDLSHAISAHEAQVNAHTSNVALLDHDRAKNLAFHNALVSRETELEPLKAKYESGIEANAKEALRLRDENIKSYHQSQEAQKKYNAAIDAEVVANTAIAKLETLKQEIDSKIKKEN